MSKGIQGEDMLQLRLMSKRLYEGTGTWHLFTARNSARPCQIHGILHMPRLPWQHAKLPKDSHARILDKQAASVQPDQAPAGSRTLAAFPLAR